MLRRNRCQEQHLFRDLFKQPCQISCITRTESSCRVLYYKALPWLQSGLTSLPGSVMLVSPDHHSHPLLPCLLTYMSNTSFPFSSPACISNISSNSKKLDEVIFKNEIIWGQVCDLVVILVRMPTSCCLRTPGSGYWIQLPDNADAGRQWWWAKWLPPCDTSGWVPSAQL